MLEQIELVTEPVEQEKEPVQLSQLLGVVYSGETNAPKKHLLATDLQTDLVLLELVNPEESVEILRS